MSRIKFTWGLTPKLTVRPKLLFSFRNYFLLLKMFNKPDSLDANVFDRDPNGGSKLHTSKKSFWDVTTLGNYSSKVSVISVQGHWVTLTVVEEESHVYDLTEIITP